VIVAVSSNKLKPIMSLIIKTFLFKNFKMESDSKKELYLQSKFEKNNIGTMV